MKGQNSFLILLGLCVHTGIIAQSIKVACIGNSVTYGYGLKDRATASYPSQLQKLLGDGYEVRNFGHSGATVLKKGHNPYYKTNAFTEALAFQPDIAIVHLGLNDTDPRNWPNYKDAYEADYAWLLDTLRKTNPAVKLYICRLTPVFSEHPLFKSGTRDWYWQIQELIPVIAKANRAALINLHEPLYKRPDLFADNLHPDATGAFIIARTVCQFITGNYEGLKPASIFTDNMVLQRKKPVAIYGSANAGEEVTVTFAGRKSKTTASTGGAWSIVFPAMEHGGPYTIVIENKETNIVFRNILVGDVWLCSGQSNMDFPLRRSEGGARELKGIGVNNKIRLFRMEALVQTDNTSWDSVTLDKINRQEFFKGSWKICDSAAAAEFSAVGYYFGKKLSKEEQVPIGLVQVSVGGSPIESWIDRYTMEQDPVLVDELTNWRKSDFYQDFCKERAAVNLKNATLVKQRHPYEPCYNYEAAIDSLTLYAVKGVIWYQGESNTHNAELYHHLFPVMVSSWRKKWGYDFPFYFVQLPGIDRPSWPSFRDMQRQLVQEVPGTGMAVTIDLGDSLNVHPARKKETGDRLAALALRYTYHQQVIAAGPSPLTAKQQAQQIIINFTGAKRLTTVTKGSLKGFELVDDKGAHLQANAFIKDARVFIPVPENKQIRKVLYAWQPFTRANLANETGLPASTFSIPVKAPNN